MHTKRTIFAATFCGKGGVGKSTSTAIIARGFALAGLKVLVINCDGQNNSLRTLNKDVAWNYTLYDLLDKKRKSIKEVAVPLAENIDGISSKELRKIEKVLAANDANLKAFFEWMFPEEETKDYDIILYDLGPSETFLNTAILSSVMAITVVCQCEFESVQAVVDTISYIKSLRPKENPQDLIKLVIPNMFDRKSISGLIVKTLETMFDKEKITLPLPRRAAISYAAIQGEDIFTAVKNNEALMQPCLDIVDKAFKNIYVACKEE